MSASPRPRSGRAAGPNEITLVAVTKKQPASAVAEALAAGVSDIGENYVQEAAEKRAQVAGRPLAPDGAFAEQQSQSLPSRSLT